jgi:protein tyrosine phosphatase
VQQQPTQSIELLKTLHSINEQPKQEVVVTPLPQPVFDQQQPTPTASPIKERRVSIDERPVNNVNTPTSEQKAFSFLKQHSDATSKLDMYLQDYKKLERHVELLSQKTLTSTTTLLEKEWKDLNDYQERQLEANKYTISVARLYPNKNRFHDLLPYDQTRVRLTKLATKGDDYINATNFGQLNSAKQQIPPPSFISTQIPVDFYEFWLMVLQEKCELLVCLCKDSEFESNYYWPKDRQTPLNFSGIKVNLQSFKETEYSAQRVLTVSLDSVSRTVVVFQYLFNSTKPKSVAPVGTGLGPNDMPDSMENFVKFVKDCERFYADEQRNRVNPILTHCVNGVSRSAVFMLVFTCVQTIDTFYEDSSVAESPSTTLSVADLVNKVVKQMRSKRKYMLQTVGHLTYSYECVLSYMRHTLISKDMIKEDSPSVLNETPKSNGTSATKKPAVSNVLTLQDVLDPNKFCLDLTDDSSSSTRRKSKFTRNDFLQQH